MMESEQSPASSPGGGGDEDSIGWGSSWEELDKKRYFGAIVCSSFFMRVFLYPFYTLKSKQQYELKDKVASSSPSSSSSSSSASASPSSSTAASRSTLGQIRAIARNEGFKSLYRGFILSSGVGVVLSPLYLSTLEMSRHHYVETCHLSPSIASMCAAMTGTLTAQLIFVPTDVIAQSAIVNKTTASHEFKNVLRVEGVRGFWRGYAASVCAFGSAGAIFWPTFSAGRLFLHKQLASVSSGEKGESSSSSLSFLATPLAAGNAAFFSTFLSNPADVCKTRVQLLKKPLAVVVKEVYAKEGGYGFLVGARARAQSATLQYALIMSAYSLVKKFATRREEEDQT